jgi:hypothetical protein
MCTVEDMLLILEKRIFSWCLGTTTTTTSAADEDNDDDLDHTDPSCGTTNNPSWLWVIFFNSFVFLKKHRKHSVKFFHWFFYCVQKTLYTAPNLKKNTVLCFSKTLKCKKIGAYTVFTPTISFTPSLHLVYCVVYIIHQNSSH